MILRINDRIRNRKVDFWNQLDLQLRYDSVGSTFSFQGYFNPQNQEHKDLYCVGHYHLCTVEHNDELLLTGHIIQQNFTGSSVRSFVQIGGLSLAGVLEHCQIPADLYPLQSDGLSLREISQKLIKPFGLKMIVDPGVASDMDSIYEETTAGEGQTIKGYLSELAAQKNIVISHNEHGDLVFTRANTRRIPILNYGEPGGPPFTSMRLSFNGQDMHSKITVMKQADMDAGNAGEEEITNPYVFTVYRPRVVLQSSGSDVDTGQVAKTALANELRALSLEIVTDRWEIDGRIIRPNNLITVVNPDVYLYKKSTWFIESVTYKGDNHALQATLRCVLPEVYSGQTPKYLFEGINLH